MSALTSDGLFDAVVNRQDVLVDQLHGSGPVGELVVQIYGETSSLQLQLLGLRRRLWKQMLGECLPVVLGSLWRC